MKQLVPLMLIVILSLGACTGKDGALDLRKPFHLDLTPPEGPIEYEQGWTDGCESGMSAYSSSFYKLVKAFDLQIDGNLRTNKMYYQAWRDAFLYCAMYWNSMQSQPF